MRSPSPRPRRTPEPSAPWRAVGLSCLLVVCGAVSTAAQDAPPVHVRFAFGDPAVAGLYPTAGALATAEEGLSTGIAGIFDSTLRYWPARAGDGTAFPLLQLQVRRDGSRWLVLVELFPVQGQPATYAQSVELFAPGDIAALGGFPPKDRLPGRIEGKVKEFYTNAVARGALQEKVAEGAPLGAAAHLTSASRPIAILPLKWERYCGLATSVFALEYAVPGGGRVMVLGQGTGEPGQFTPDAPMFTGVMVLPQRWVKAGIEEDLAPHSAELAGLTPRFFRVKKLNTDPAACIDVEGAPPSIAQ